MITKSIIEKQKTIKPLSEIVEFLDHLRKPVRQDQRGKGNYPYYGANGQQGNINDYIFNEPLILLAEDGGNFGDPTRTISYQVDGKYWVNNHAHVLRVKKGNNINYINYHLSHYDVRPFINGATRSKLNKSQAEKILLFTPNENEQKRIAFLLNKADTIRKKRRETIRLADEFLRSTFLDMFGDPVLNKKGWRELPFKKLATDDKNSIRRGPFGSSLKKDMFIEKGYLIYEQYHALNKDFSYRRYFIDERKFNELIAFKVVPGDIIISCSGVYLGKLAEVPKDAPIGIINQALLKITLDNNIINNKYFLFIFSDNNMQHKMLGQQRGSGIPNFPPMSVVNEFSFPVPPIELQNKFAEIVEKTEKLKEKYEESLQESENLFNSLMQRAFKGEL